MSVQQLECLNFCHSKGYDMVNDDVEEPESVIKQQLSCRCTSVTGDLSHISLP